MKNTGIILGVVAICVILVLVFTNNSASNDGGVVSDTREEVEETTKLSSTFKDLIGAGKSYQCQFAGETEMGSVSGEVFVASDTKLRGQYYMEDGEGQKFDIEVIQDGEFTYVWGDSPFGEVALKTAIAETGDGGDTSQNILESDEEFEFDCSRWRVDSSLFVPPAGIDFNQFTIPDITSGEMEIADVCSSCDQAPAGQARDMCLESLKSFGC